MCDTDARSTNDSGLTWDGPTVSISGKTILQKPPNVAAATLGIRQVQHPSTRENERTRLSILTSCTFAATTLAGKGRDLKIQRGKRVQRPHR